MFMKKSILLLAMAVYLLSAQVYAAGISQPQAQNIALNYFKMKVPAAAANSALSVSLSYTQTETDGTNDFYVYNVSPMNGFVIVAGDNNAIPVIAWSSESHFIAGDFSKIGLSDWMKSAAKRIHYVVTNHVQADANIQNLWTSYAQGISPQSTRSGGAIGPLCATTWNQNPYYNALCPPASLPSSSNSKAVTGCVATAMGQIMKYWNYPAQGTGGVISYNDNGGYGYANYGTLSANMNRRLYWSNMPNNVNSETDPVDSLMYELGVAVNMSYDSTGSGAFVLSSETGGGPCSQTVYATNFYYNPATLQGVQLASYTTSAWIGVMENEINSGRVVQYEGDDPTEGGHTWVMDGYEPNSAGDYLHMNWGWGGYENGWFSVTNLATPGFNPSQNDAALIGIEPLLPYSLVLTPASPSVCPNGSTTLSVAGPASATYTWTPATGLTCTTCTSPVATPASTTLYKVTVDSAGIVATMSVVVKVTEAMALNFSLNAAPTCNLPENVAFTNTTTNATSYLWDFGDNSTSTSSNPVHSYTTNGNYTVSLYATNSCGADSLIRSQAVQVVGGPPTGTSATICSGQTAIVTATGSNINWYADAAGTSVIQTGGQYITPALTASTTYYVASAISPSPVSAGPATDAIGTASEYTATGLRGMYFNNTVAQTLNTVLVYAQGAGDRQFILEDSLGTTIYDSMTVALLDGQQTVSLYFSVPVGNGLLLAINGTTNMYRNSAGAVFPYVSTDGTVSITGNNAGAAGRYYFLYNWQMQQNACTTNLVPVTAYVLNGGGGSFVATGTGSPSVTFTADDQSATSYEWSFGDGATSALINPAHTYASAGTYPVQLILSNGTCSDTVTRSINTETLLGINALTDLPSLAVYPNPAKDEVTLGINASKPSTDCQLSINNVLGQSVYSKAVDLASGPNTVGLNVSNLTAGIYFISLQNGKDQVTTKFVKE
jgi:PKD repeat protein